MPASKNIKKRIRGFLRKYLPALIVFGKGVGLLYSRRSFLRQSGYIKSVVTKRPCRKDGSPIPWMNYSIVSFLEGRLNKDMSLFEFGSGNSTLFYANLVGDVVSIENDRKWYDYFVNSIPGNVKLILCDPYDTEKYSNAIAGQGKKFDVVVVDGMDRVECIVNAFPHLSPTGVIILDDTQGTVTQPGIDYLLERGLKRLDFEGLKPGGIRAYRTTIFYTVNNCLGI